MNEEETFTKLWTRYLGEMEARYTGEAGARAIGFYAAAFRMIAGDAQLGIALFAQESSAGEVGVLLWGSLAPLPFETAFGRIATGFGTYVDPAHRCDGLARDMRRFARRELALAGFDSVLGAVHVGNRAGQASVVREGFQPFQTSYVLDLHGVPHGD